MVESVSEDTSEQPQEQSGGKTYLTNVTTSFSEYCSNEEFKRLLSSGAFVFVEPGHFVIANPKYIRTTENGPRLTPYALNHLDECALRFINEVTEEKTQRHDSSRTPGGKESAYSHTPVLDSDNHNLAVFQRSQELRDFHNELVEQSRRLAQAEINFAQLAAWHIKEKGYNKTVFREKTHLSFKTYERIVSNRLPNPDLATVMAICIGLQLSIKDSEDLLEKAGYRLSSSPQHLAYHKLLSTFIGHSLTDCNEVLEALDLSPITPKSQKSSSHS
jgi:hypothetical protein